MKKITLIILLSAFTFPFFAQELNATVTINHSKVQGTRQVFNTLEEQLRTFINDRKWTETDFLPTEKIDCSFTLIINEAVSPTSFNAELLVQARRPVFNATYTTTLVNFRDAAVAFDYIEYQPLDFDINNIQNNLTATIAFYVNLILGLDFDSMSPLGGTPYFRQMQIIANNVQPNNWKGWETFGSERNKFALAVAFNEPAFESYRQMWYDYHRLGLDKMAENSEKGREKVLSSLSEISSLYGKRLNSVLITLFGDAKLDELAGALSGATDREKRESRETLQQIYPTRTAELERIK